MKGADHGTRLSTQNLPPPIPLELIAVDSCARLNISLVTEFVAKANLEKYNASAIHVGIVAPVARVDADHMLIATAEDGTDFGELKSIHTHRLLDKSPCIINDMCPAKDAPFTRESLRPQREVLVGRARELPSVIPIDARWRSHGKSMPFPRDG